MFTFHEISSFILFCVPSSFGQSAKKFRWMLNGIRPFSFIRLITWKYIRLSFALLCFFFGIFWVWMQKMRLLHLPLGPMCVCVSNVNICCCLLFQFHVSLYAWSSRCQLYFTCQRIVSYWSFFFLFGIIGTHVIIFILHPQPVQPTFESVDFKLFPCHSTFFSFFLCVQSNPYHRKSFAVWVSHLMWKLNGWLTFMSGVIW